MSLLLPAAGPSPLAAPFAPARGPATPAPVPFGVGDALAAVRSAAPRLGVDTSDLSVVQVVSTVVLRAGSVALKVYAPGVDVTRLEAAARVVASAPGCWVVPLGEPVATPCGVVVAYPWVDAGPQADWAEMGALVRRWHDTAMFTVDLPRWTPLSRVPAQLGAYAVRPDADPGLVRLALEIRERLVDAAAAVRSGLGWGVIHGDLGPSNVLRRAGTPVFVDLDWVAIGPREYDLVPCAQRLQRGEVDQATYEGFAAAYGHDVRGWSGLELIEEICAFGGTTFALWLACTRGDDVGWLPAAMSRYA